MARVSENGPLPADRRSGVGSGKGMGKAQPAVNVSPASRSLRIAFAGAVALIVAMLAVFAYSLADSQSRQRRDVEKRFHDRATVSAALTDAIFSLSATQTQAQGALRFGGRSIDRAALIRTVRQSQGAYAEIIDSDGRVLAATPGAPPRPAASAPYVAAALRDRKSHLSDLLPGPRGTRLIEWAIPFRARTGQRVQLSGLSQPLIAQFLGSFLERVPNEASASSYVLDGRGSVIAGTKGSATRRADHALAQAVRQERQGDYGDGRYFTSAPIAGSSWRIVLSASQGKLYDSINGGRRAIPWIIFAAFALTALIGLVLLRRVLLAGRELERAELSRTHALEINDNIVQRLVMAKYALDRGATETTQDKVAETLHEAQQLVISMLEEREIEPGVLRRKEAAQTDHPPAPPRPD
jgi:hypothetical protein